MAGVPQSMATNPSEEIGKEEEVVGGPCVSGSILILLSLMMVTTGLRFYGDFMRFREKAITAEVLVQVCYGLPHQDQETNNIFFRHLAEVT